MLILLISIRFQTFKIGYIYIDLCLIKNMIFYFNIFVYGYI